VWNRVVLLIAGVACGWNLVHVLSAPADRARRHRVWVALAVVAGIGMSAALVPSSGVGAFVLGLVVFLGSAVVAYAGNARELGKEEDPLPRPRPEPPTSGDPRPVVILVADGEPETYTGPGPWAREWRRRAHAGPEAAPHWLLRPLTYTRIRAAYGVLPPEDTVQGWLSTLARRLDRSLGGEYRVQEAFLRISPSLASTLFHLAEDGHRTVLLVPVGYAQDVAAPLREVVTRSRVREVGVSVDYAPVLGIDSDVADVLGARLPALARGQAPPRLADYADALQAEAEQRVAAWDVRPS